MPRKSATVSGLGEDQSAIAYRSIRRMILEGGLPPGHSTSHRSLAEQLGLGRSPVRDAILRLEAEGLVVQEGQRGILLREPTPQELAEIYELRLVMEPFFAERAAILATPVQVGVIEEACEQFTAIANQADLPAWLDDDKHCHRIFQIEMQFHATILAAAGNSVAARIFNSAHVLSHVFALTGPRASSPRLLQRIVAAAVEHTAVYEAIRDRDPTRARERMRQHVLDAIPAVTARYAEAVAADTEAAERSNAKRAAAAVRRRKTR